MSCSKYGKIIAGFVVLSFVGLWPWLICWSSEIFIKGLGKPAINEMLDNLPPQFALNKELRANITALFTGYKGYCIGLDLRPDGELFVIMSNGAKLIYDDGKKKRFRDKLENPDLKDMLSTKYPIGKVTVKTPADFDPGRFRVVDFFKAIYGSTKTQVSSNLKTLRFCGKPVRFNSNNEAARALNKVGSELENAIKANPGLSKFVFPLAGSFSWRHIAGTSRLSAHSFGIAIDLNPRRGVYWRGKKASFDILGAVQEYPYEIVRIFEKNGFIWGGKWSHFDLMHFEYRPEFFVETPN